MTELTSADMSRVHRFAVGDRVEFDPQTYDHIDAPPGIKVEGVVVSFANDEQSHLNVEITDDEGNKTIHPFTEDELHRLG